jgi:hypothetical protein
MFADVARYQYKHYPDDYFDAWDAYPVDDLPADDHLNETIRWARPSFSVVHIDPEAIGSFGPPSVALRLDPPAAPGHCYCKFDQDVVKGWVNGSGWAICPLPKLPPGMIVVRFSKDAQTWFGPIVMRSAVPSGLDSLMVFVPIGMAVMLGCGGLVWALIVFANNHKAAAEPAQFLGRGKKN